MSLPIFDDSGFTGEQLGSFTATVGADCSLFAGPAFTAQAGTFTDIALRTMDDGGENTLLIAAPRLVGPAPDEIFEDGFEEP